MKKHRLLSFIGSIVIICCIMLSLFSALIGAEQISDSAYERLYSVLDTFDEPHFVSRAFLDFGPSVFVVLNENVQTLTYQEKIGICLDYLYEDLGPEYGQKSTYPMKGFKNVYYNIFGEEFEPQVGLHFFYNIDYAKEVVEIWVNEDSIEYLESVDLSQPRYGVYYLKDYSLSEKELLINVAVRIIDEEKDQYVDEGILNEIKSSFSNYWGSSQGSGGDELGGYHWDRDFFQDSVDHTIWEEYSEYFTLYTMKYEKDSDGYWHWISCTLANPSTDDTAYLFYPVLFVVSTAGIIVLVLKRRMATVQK